MPFCLIGPAEFFCRVCRFQTGGVFLYAFSDLDTVRDLPDVLSITKLSAAIGLSISRTHELMDDMRIPYLKLGKRKVIFKEHLIEGLSGKSSLTDVAKLNAVKSLPRNFPPKYLIDVFSISNGNAYIIVRTPGFPAIFSRNRIVVNKQGLIEWIRKNERYNRKE